MKNYKESTKNLFVNIAKRYYTLHKDKYGKDGKLKKSYRNHRDFRFLSEYQRAFNIAMSYGNAWRELDTLSGNICKSVVA